MQIINTNLLSLNYKFRNYVCMWILVFNTIDKENITGYGTTTAESKVIIVMLALASTYNVVKS